MEIENLKKVVSLIEKRHRDYSLKTKPKNDDGIFNFKHNISKLSQTFLSIDSLDIFSVKQKNKLKISLFDKYINQLINKHFEK